VAAPDDVGQRTNGGQNARASRVDESGFSTGSVRLDEDRGWMPSGKLWAACFGV